MIILPLLVRIPAIQPEESHEWLMETVPIIVKSMFEKVELSTVNESPGSTMIPVI
ncbi:Uncharacterised protein [uncultured archaeon]|nr:Uncharacterised protein [uncultured archaeon]